jgi:hypothetical protein
VDLEPSEYEMCIQPDALLCLMKVCDYVNISLIIFTCDIPLCVGDINKEMNISLNTALSLLDNRVCVSN